jgi:hypothetical protein
MLAKWPINRYLASDFKYFLLYLHFEIYELSSITHTFIEYIIICIKINFKHEEIIDSESILRIYTALGEL